MLQRINDVTYKVHRTARAKLQIVHRNRLKRYKGDMQLGWWERAASGVLAEEEPAREERQETSGSGPQASPPGPSISEAVPELPEQSGSVLGGVDLGADSHGGSKAIAE